MRRGEEAVCSFLALDGVQEARGGGFPGFEKKTRPLFELRTLEKPLWACAVDGWAVACRGMGAELSIEDAPTLSNAAARDACTGQLGRGRLIDSHGSSHVHDAKWRAQVQALLDCDDDALCEPVPTGFHFDLNARIGTIERTLQEPKVAQARYRLVPRKLTENAFWRAVFWRLRCAEMDFDSKGCLSPAPRSKAAFEGHGVLASPVGREDYAPIRRPLACRMDSNGWEDYDIGSPGDCQRSGLYTPNGTSMQGYDEFCG